MNTYTESTPLAKKNWSKKAISAGQKIIFFIQDLPLFCLYKFFCLFPLKKKVLATAFRGKKYGDNPQFIVEAIHRLDPSIDIVWLKDDNYDYEVPDYVRTVSYHSFIARNFEYATSKVWFNTHRLERSIRKRKGQLFMETWHGGLGIKMMEGDVKKIRETPWEVAEIIATAKNADVLVSNSKHLTDIYRRTFDYDGLIWRSGFPRNDVMLVDKGIAAHKHIRNYYNLPSDVKIMLFAPTFRSNIWEGNIDFSLYDIDYEETLKTINENWDGNWVLFVRWHPAMVKAMSAYTSIFNDHVIDATRYPDMQELILGIDGYLSDYSSGIFDAAMRDIPCLTFATDFDKYKQVPGVYYDMQELPFPYSTSKEELKSNIANYNHEDFLEKWNKFKIRMGLRETGHAAQDIARVAVEYICGNEKPFLEIEDDR